MSRARDLANVADDVSTGTVVVKDGSNDVTLNDITAGGIYLGGTGAANYLDDYEEGTWTPVFTPQSGSFTSVSYANRAGRYVKVGNVVHYSGEFYTSELTLGTASGSLKIGGLPFTSNDDLVSAGYLKGDIRIFSGQEPLATQVDTSATTISLYYRTSVDGSSAQSNVSDLTTGSTAANIIGFGGSYYVS